jgi:hypothetical protein
MCACLPLPLQLAAAITAPSIEFPLMLVIATRPISAYLDVVVRTVPGALGSLRVKSSTRTHTFHLPQPATHHPNPTPPPALSLHHLSPPLVCPGSTAGSLADPCVPLRFVLQRVSRPSLTCLVWSSFGCQGCHSRFVERGSPSLCPCGRQARPLPVPISHTSCASIPAHNQHEPPHAVRAYRGPGRPC